jgi:hypothetical protein
VPGLSGGPFAFGARESVRIWWRRLGGPALVVLGIIVGTIANICAST